MGFFSPLDEKFIATVAPDYRDQVDRIRQIAWEESDGISFHKRREIQFVLTAIWMDFRFRRESIGVVAPRASLGLIASFQDQARRIGQKFESVERFAFDISLQSIQSSGLLDEDEAVED